MRARCPRDPVDVMALRFWLHGYAKTSALAPSAALSIAVHAAALGGALYHLDARASASDRQEAERIRFLPPPDRYARSNAAAERVEYVELSPGRAPAAPEAEGGELPPLPIADSVSRGEGTRRDPLLQAEQLRNDSDDSVHAVLSVEESAVRVDGSSAPAYPPELLRSGVEGAVLARFVIDTTGRVDPATFQVLRASHPAFLESVREALTGMRFSPATSHGRHVRELVEQSFQFRLSPPVAAPAEHTRATPAQ
jgi:protein TonB